MKQRDAAVGISLSDLLGPYLGQGASSTIHWNGALPVGGLAVDSRRVEEGAVFFARPGVASDGIEFVDEALSRGAAAVVVPADDPRGSRDFGVPTARVADVAQCLGLAADRFFAKPSCALTAVAVTGTNGKTSVVHYVAEALTRLGEPCGVIGTLGAGVFPLREGTARTTPDTIELHELLCGFAARGARFAVMEASSHGLAQGRLAGVRFRCAALTNVSRDHLDYHGSDAAYRAAKARLFAWPELDSAVLNANDRLGAALLATTGANTLGFGLDIAPHDVTARHRLIGTLTAASGEHIALDVNLDGNRASLCPSLLGRFNAENMLAALGILVSLDVPFEEAIGALVHATPAPGRMQHLPKRSNRPTVVIDYSHTPDALEAALQTLAPFAKGRLWCVFGCGGDRDRGKRVLMGEAARKHADRVVVTSDNPRSEPPARILQDILQAWPENALLGQDVQVNPDREQAIQAAIVQAAPEDIVLIAGKGHERYQVIGDEVRPFDDYKVAGEALARRSSC